MLFSTQNKEFVYRGHEFERLTAFSERLLSEFMGAKLLTTNLPPQDEIKQGQGQRILAGCVCVCVYV